MEPEKEIPDVEIKAKILQFKKYIWWETSSPYDIYTPAGYIRAHDFRPPRIFIPVHNSMSIIPARNPAEIPHFSSAIYYPTNRVWKFDRDIYYYEYRFKEIIWGN